MVLFKCLYCKKEFYHKGNYLKHNDLCKQKLEELIAKYKSYNKENLMKEFELVANSLNLEIYCEKYKCKKCDKVYKSYNGLKDHLIKNKCGINKIDICDRIINNYNNKMLKVNNTSNTYNTTNTNCNNNNNNTNITNNTQNNINNNINNNIKLVPYDEIKYDYMEESVLRKAFEIPGEAFQSITADTFFNPDNKENHVIYCPNLKDSQIHIYNGNKFSNDGWDILDKKKFFKEMIRRQMGTLEKIFKCNEEDDNILELTNITGFKNLLKEYNANDEVIKEYSAILNRLCYKNNHIVKPKDSLILKNI